MEFPENGEIIYKFSSDLDEFGDGTYISVVDIGRDNYITVYEKIIESNFKVPDTPTNYSFVLSEIKPMKVNSEFVLQTPGKYKKIVFLDDNSSVIINLVQW